MISLNLIQAGIEVLEAEGVRGMESFFVYLRKFWLPENISVYPGKAHGIQDRKQIVELVCHRQGWKLL